MLQQRDKQQTKQQQVKVDYHIIHIELIMPRLKLFNGQMIQTVPVLKISQILDL